MTVTTRVVRAPRGSSLHCLAWPQEAAFRMIQNNLDPDVAERPEDLIVYGGTGRAARSWPAFDRILQTLARLKSDETLLVQSGKPVGVFHTHEWAPRVLIANALIVPRWATWDEFRRLEDAGLTMYGQMTAGSWIYIGTQGILQGTYETFAAVARTHFDGSLAGRLVVTAGLGGMGGAQPMAVAMNEGVALVVEVDPARAERRKAQGFLDEIAPSLDEALARIERYRRQRTARSVGLVANAADVLPDLVLELFPEDRTLARWLRLARDRVPFQGLPARVCWLGYGERATFGERIDDLVAKGELKAPIVIGRDHLDSGSVASPFRETEDMRDGSDAIADWPILNALVNASSGATWVSVHHGGGVGIGNSIHAGMVVVADGTPLGREKLRRVLTTDPGTGVMRHADAGYPDAIEFARRNGIDLPST